MLISPICKRSAFSEICNKKTSKVKTVQLESCWCNEAK